MAESYKGLTIRIGADTTDFSRKLGSLNSAISATQSGLKQMRQALRNDPQSLSAMNQQFQLMQNQTQNLNAKLQLTNSMLRQMDDAGMGQLASQTKNSALEVRMLTDRLNQVNALLEQEHKRLSTFPEINGKAYDPEHPKAYAYAVRQAAEAGDQLAIGIREEVEKSTTAVSRLQREHNVLETQLKQMQQIETYKSLQRDAIAYEAELKKMYADMTAFKMAMPSKAEAEKLNVLESEFKELESEMKIVEEQAEAARKSMKLDPSSIEKFNKAVEMTQREMKLAHEQAENLRKRIDAIKQANGLKEVSGDLSALKADARTAGERFDKINDELAQVKARITQARSEFDSFSNTAYKSSEEVAKNKEKAKEVAAEIKVLKEREKELAQEAKKAGEEVKMADAKVGVKELEAQLGKTERKIEQMGEAAQRSKIGMYNSMRDMATSLGATVAPAVAMVTSKVVSSASTIDGAFRDMKKTVDGTQEDFEHLRQAAIDFSRTHPVSADTILEVESLGGQLGIAVENLEDFAEVVSNLDIATNLSAETAATQLGQLNNILHWEKIEFEDGRSAMAHYGDALVRLGNNMPTQEDRISSITMAIASTGQVMHMTTPEILGWATAIAATGQGAESSGTAISNTMIDIEAAVGDGGDALDAFAEVAGMSADEFANKWKTAPSEALFDFVNGLKQFSDEGGSATKKLDELEIRGVRQVRALLSLGETIDIVRDAQDMASDAWQHGGDAAREAAQKSEGFSGKLKILENIVQTLGASFGDKLVPVLDAAIEALQVAITVIDDMPQPVALAIAALAGLAIVVPPIMRNYAQFRLTMIQFASAENEATLATKIHTAAMEAGIIGNKKGIKSFADLKNGITQFASKMGLASKAMTVAKAGMVGLAIAGAAILITKIVELIKKQKEYKQATEGMKDAFYLAGGAAEDMSGRLDSVSVHITKDIDDLIQKALSFREELVNLNQGAIDNGETLQKWYDIMAENNGSMEYNTTGVNRLKMAVDELNERMGTSYKVIEKNGEAYVAEADGARADIDAIGELVEAKKQEMIINAYVESQKKIINETAEAERVHAEALNNLKVAQDEYEKALREYPEYADAALFKLQQAEEEERRAKGVVDGLTNSYAAAEGALYREKHATDEFGIAVRDLAKQMPWLSSSLDELSADSFSNFIAAAQKAGYTTQDLELLTTEEVAKITEAWDLGSDEWVNVIEGAKVRAASQYGDMVETIESDTDEMAKSTSEDTRSMADKVVSEFEEMKTKAIRQIANMTGMTEQELRDLADEAGITSEEAMNNWVHGITASEDKSAKAARMTAFAATNQLNAAAREAGSAGEDFGLGFALGIDKYLGRAATSAAQLGVSAVNSLKNATREASPSKLTRQAGVFFGQGFALGMEDEERSIEKQAAMLGNLATGALAASSTASMGYLSGRASAAMGYRNSTTNNNDNSVENIHITLNVEARDMRDVQTIQDIVNIAKRAQAQYAS